MSQNGRTGFLAHAWNVFLNRNPTDDPGEFSGRGWYNNGGSPGQYIPRMTRDGILIPIFNRIAVDVSMLDFKHVRIDKTERISEIIEGPLNNRLTMRANADQTGRMLIKDIVMTMFDNGVAVVVPVDTSQDPKKPGTCTIKTLRVGTIEEFGVNHILVNLFNRQTMERETVPVLKSQVAVITNPFYEIMNEPNSTLQRLINKLSGIDVIDNRSITNKLDLIVQLPYMVKSETKKRQAKERVESLADQLSGSSLGVGYTDATEKVIQLNRPVNNSLLPQVEMLRSDLWDQTGLTKNIMNGTAKDEELQNYYARAIGPVATAISDGLTVSFLTKTARAQAQRVKYYRDPFKLMSMDSIAEAAEKMTSAEILSSNDFRSILGRLPDKDPRSDELINKNINPKVPKDQQPKPSNTKDGGEDEE